MGKSEKDLTSRGSGRQRWFNEAAGGTGNPRTTRRTVASRRRSMRRRWSAAGATGSAAVLDPVPGPEGPGDLRGPRIGRQGWRHQADHRTHLPAHRPRGRRCRSRPSGSAPSGTSRSMSSTSPPRVRWSSSTGRGSTAPTSEWVMGFCSEEEHAEFLRSCPEFERMLVVRIVVIKYWFSVSFEEQRPASRPCNAEPLKRWKLSDMDLAEHGFVCVKYPWPRQHLPVHRHQAGARGFRRPVRRQEGSAPGSTASVTC